MAEPERFHHNVYVILLDSKALRHPSILRANPKRDPAKPLINNGIIGDPRLSSVEIGKRIFDMRVAYAVTEIQRLIQGKR